MENQKMRLGKYISIFVASLVFFVLAWSCIKIDVISGDLETSKWIVIGVGVITIIATAAITINIFTFSVVGFIKSLKVWKEKGLWKILTLVFRTALLLFSITILLLFIIWFSVGLSWVSDFKKSPLFGSSNAWESTFLVMVNINWRTFLKTLDKVDLPAIFITMFVFICLWSAGGFTFEIIKKTLGGYKPKEQKTKEIENK